MREKIRILVISSGQRMDGRIPVDEEAREIFERLQEGPYAVRFQLHTSAALKLGDLQKSLLLYEPHIVHFSGHGHKGQRSVDEQALTNLFALYSKHVRLVLLNASCSKAHARSISSVINYSVGTSKGIGAKVGVTFAGAFYRALGFGKSVRDAFESAKAELALTKVPRSGGIELFVRNGVSERDRFPRTVKPARRRNRLSRRHNRRLCSFN